MTAPVHEKTWQIVPNECDWLDPSTTTTIDDSQKVLILLIKDTFTGFSSNPWIVESCSNAVVVGNNDQVDRWATVADIVNGTGNHSWVVLKSVNGQQVCLDFRGSFSSIHLADIRWSPSVGFGVANGGTDGTISARPTATDEVAIITGGAWMSDPSLTSARFGAVNFWHASDGSCTRMVICTHGKGSNVWAFETPKNPVAAFLPAAFCVFNVVTTSTTTNCFGYDQLSDANTHAFFRTTANGEGDMYLATPGYLSGNGIGEHVHSKTGMDAAPGLRGAYPVLLISETTLLTGPWGSLFDWYWANDTHTPGDQLLDVNGDVAWVCVGEAWMPWTAAAGKMVMG